jgi:Bacterial Ig-like domain (group 3)/PASTA domain
VLALAVVAGTAAVLSLGTASADPLRSTSTSLSCPAERDIHQSATCTATVTDTDTGTATTPTGAVEFSATNAPGVALRARCTLSAGSCQVTYVGRASATPGPQTITATYEGDSAHARSSDTQDVYVVVGPRPPCCFLPRVKGQRLAQAKRVIRHWGFSVGTIHRAFSKRVARGRVIAQRPGGGRLVAPHRKVGLVVSKGKRHARP